MKLSRMSALALALCLSMTPVYAAPSASGSADTKAPQQDETVKKDQKELKHKHGWRRQQDPLKAMEERKAKVQELLKEGKLTKEKADKITARIDARINEFKEFDKLSLPEKKARLKSKFKAALDQRVSEGKLTQEQANEWIKKHDEKVEAWDGKGFPHLFKKGCKMKAKPGMDMKQE